MLKYHELRTEFKAQRGNKDRMPEILIGITLFAAILACSVAFASPLPSDKAVLAVIGEAEDQGYTGMLAVACALRNRGTLKGVYGINSPRIKKALYSKETFFQAKKAWEESAYKDITNGATNWENTRAFGTPYWAKTMTKVFKHKDHVFYREG